MYACGELCKRGNHSTFIICPMIIQSLFYSMKMIRNIRDEGHGVNGAAGAVDVA